MAAKKPLWGDKNPLVLMQLIAAFSLQITIKKVNLSKFVIFLFILQ